LLTAVGVAPAFIEHLRAFTRTVVAVDGPTNGTFELIVLNDEN